MKSSNISFTGIIPLNKQSLKCEKAINKIADICTDKKIDFDTITIGNIEYVFTGKDVKKYLDYYQEISSSNTLQKESCLDVLDKIKKTLAKIRPEEIAKREKPSIVEDLMVPNPHLNLITEGKKKEISYKDKALMDYCQKLTLKLNGVSLSPKKSPVDTDLSDEQMIEKAIENDIKKGYLKEYLNEICTELSIAVNNQETNFDNFSTFLHAKMITPLEPDVIIKSINNNRFDCEKGNFKNLNTKKS